MGRRKNKEIGEGEDFSAAAVAQPPAEEPAQVPADASDAGASASSKKKNRKKKAAAAPAVSAVENLGDGNDFALLETESVQDVGEGGKKKKSRKKKKKAGKKKYPYHPKSGLAGKEGYLGGLTEKEEAALEALKEQVETELADVNVEALCLQPAESEDTLLLRFLRARSFDVKAAFKMFRDFAQWHARENIGELRGIEDAKEILGCDESVILREVPHWLQAFDKQGRPVIIKEFGHCHIGNVLPHTTQEKLQRYHVWCNERYARHLAAQSEKLSHNIETSVYIVDAAGWQLALATKAAYAFLQGMSEIDNNFYPERLGVLYVVNAPKTLSVAWAIIKRWLDQRTREKINILSGQDQYGPQLLEFIDANELPDIYGGKGKSKKPEIPAE